MSERTKRSFAVLASSILVAASIAATPASAQTGGGDDGGPRPGDPCNPVVGGYYGPMECCYYPGQGWYYYLNINGGGDCGYVYYQPPETSDDRPSGEPTEPAGR
jgi:hypothetical protein